MKQEEFCSLNKDSASYIEYMAKTIGHDVSTWDFSKFMGDAGKPLVKKSAINKRFMELVESKPVAVKSDLNPTQKTYFETEFRRLMNKDKDHFLQEMRKWEEQISALTVQFNATLTNLTNAQAKYDAHTPKNNDVIMKQLDRLLSEGFWEVGSDCGPSYFELVTKNDIVLKRVNKAAGINIEVNLGRFKAHVYANTNNFIPKVYEYKNNVKIGAKPHPHVAGGALCWGNIAEMVANANAKQDMYQVLRLVQELLLSYHDRNPFVPLEHLHMIRKVYEWDVKNKKEITTKDSNGTVFMRSEGTVKMLLDAQRRVVEQSGGKFGTDIADLLPFYNLIVSNGGLVTYKDGGIYSPEGERPSPGIRNVNLFRFIGPVRGASGTIVDLYGEGLRDDAGLEIYENYNGARIDFNGNLL